MILERKTGFNIEQILTDTEKIMPLRAHGKITQELKDFLVLQNLYNAAIKEISTKLEILDEEFQVLYSHNPIHHIESRLKSPRSIVKKLREKALPLSIESIKKNITDIAGIRVICYYIDEVYTVADLLSKQDDVAVLKRTDYLKDPKPSGYRSLHMVVTVPVFLSKKNEIVPVEIQIRTIAMDFWASLEHQLGYKALAEGEDDLHRELKDCAEEISAVDLKMQDIYNRLKSKKTKAE
jgi:putative GTP pyrophosphokinase